VRATADQLRLERAPTDVAALVRAAVKQAQARTERHTVALVVEAEPDGVVWAEIDTARVEQVVTNLLDNAIKYSPDGGLIEVRLSHGAPGRLRLTVRDQGIGVPEEHRPHLFERFYQAHADTHRSGLGLGLYICRQIVARHGGEITAEFPPEGGTRMVVTLPVRPSADEGDTPAIEGLEASTRQTA
jgi:signal transduction histidine kinase